MKYVVCVPDGCSDHPVPELGGLTPLEAAHTPTLDRLAARGTVGQAAVIPEGMAPGSDVGNMSLLGYDPRQFHTGRAPIEAAALGMVLPEGQIAFRANLVVLNDDATEMVDFAGGHPDSEIAAAAMAALDERLGGPVPDTDGHLGFTPGVQYRHIMVAPDDWLDAECIPPHDLSGKALQWPTGPGADELRRIMDTSAEVLAEFPELAATHVWLWGQGTQPALDDFAGRWGVSAGMVTAVDLVRGLGVLSGMEVVEVEGATGWYDTDYEAKRDAALAGLEAGKDLFVIHVEATDEAGHAGDVAAKVEALENWDRRILTDLVERLDALGPWRMLLLPDHPTPVALKTHTTEPVPYLLVDSAQDGAGGTYSEPGVADEPVLAGHRLMAELLQREPQPVDPAGASATASVAP
ncbi:2,3-bisphosphoglycerate-independent phosphoglycerate mutase [Candidatus Neomicrothrix sp.]|jgi:2,3-bisphosphoglycerate-independent phosphoglycerate mutase|uniref:2,3-bisphosphoglycerate-independent phosphoglycerate mutase n=1 Tax=Candidatus Neomicrothrix subdominans TaxID=2954438 RepID=A0A936N919_9ACTN|nr:2,3-bisphosphoglycerate-independent phosphoglycerate mutase [Candidatus Microthrix sp.]MBK6968957.1 2,3-bisphosphoglycerate-independent phosphoglycerate mutase [Candidatus Microthrix sp.]MBK9295877.1 2,3-bisphosphoglycerate-independent phosphoglycerate mutase [Candidatus Microthrix subdominans]HMS47195.1 2,3-bisphosphoglycerate-independent phosphoglycerate mutase [Candidatus Microthrix sp.]